MADRERRTQEKTIDWATERLGERALRAGTQNASAVAKAMADRERRTQKDIN